MSEFSLDLRKTIAVTVRETLAEIYAQPMREPRVWFNTTQAADYMTLLAEVCA